jgi:hypothetical protein
VREVPDQWPDPLGFITTDEPRWVEPQTGWKRTGAFKGNVRGSIPDPRDNRHPDLPNDAFALTGVIITPPDREAKHHVAARNIPFERPPDSWVVDLKYECCNGSYTSDVYLFSTEIEDPQRTSTGNQHPTAGRNGDGWNTSNPDLQPSGSWKKKQGGRFQINNGRSKRKRQNQR